MRRAILLHLLSVSLIAGNLSYCPDFQPDGPLTRSSKRDAFAVPASSLPAPSDGPATLIRNAGGVRTVLMRGREGRSLSAAVKAVGRVCLVLRGSLPKPAADRFQALLWAHTCSVSLPHQHIRMQV